MYLRFVVEDIDEDSQRMLGVFHAVRNLRDEGRLCAYEEEEHDFIVDWFGENLKKPLRFSTFKRSADPRRNKAICWCRDTAHEHLAEIWGLVSLLERNGVAVRLLKARQVGYVVYEDEYQVVAEPFADTRC